MALKDLAKNTVELNDEEIELVSGGFSGSCGSFRIDVEKCINCSTCIFCCPVDAIRIQGNSVCGIDQGKCVVCGSCAENCPVRAISQ